MIRYHEDVLYVNVTISGKAIQQNDSIVQNCGISARRSAQNEMGEAERTAWNSAGTMAALRRISQNPSYIAVEPSAVHAPRVLMRTPKVTNLHQITFSSDASSCY